MRFIALLALVALVSAEYASTRPAGDNDHAAPYDGDHAPRPTPRYPKRGSMPTHDDRYGDEEDYGGDAPEHDDRYGGGRPRPTRRHRRPAYDDEEDYGDAADHGDDHYGGARPSHGSKGDYGAPKGAKPSRDHKEYDDDVEYCEAPKGAKPTADKKPAYGPVKGAKPTADKKPAYAPKGAKPTHDEKPAYGPVGAKPTADKKPAYAPKGAKPTHDEKPAYGPVGAKPAADKKDDYGYGGGDVKDTGGDRSPKPCPTNGAMKCNGKGFDTCDNGSTVYRDCGPGTECRPFQESILCDWPGGSPS